MGLSVSQDRVHVSVSAQPHSTWGVNCAISVLEAELDSAAGNIQHLNAHAAKLSMHLEHELQSAGYDTSLFELRNVAFRFKREQLNFRFVADPLKSKINTTDITEFPSLSRPILVHVAVVLFPLLVL